MLKHLLLSRLPDSWLEPLKRRHYASVLRNFDESQEPDLAVIRRLVPAGSTVVDLGANIGVYTKLMSSLTGSSGRVISVEPIPSTFRILTSNCHALGIENAQLLNVAVSDRAAELLMEVPSYARGGDNFYMARVVTSAEPLARETRRRVLVRSLALDDIVSGTQHVALVKCDIEGHELQCLEGAKSVLATQAAWLMEVSGDPEEAGSLAARVFSVFRDFGYSPWFFDGRYLNPRRPGDQRVNYFFLAERHISMLQCGGRGLLR